MGMKPSTIGTPSDRDQEPGFRVQGSGARGQGPGFGRRCRELAVKLELSRRPNFKFQISNFKSTKFATKFATKISQGPNFKFQISNFKPVLAALALLATCHSAIAAEAPALRNPFWPVGYAPKAAATQEVEAVAAPVLSDEELWLQTPVGAEEWEAALAALPKPGGLFIGLHPETREKVDKMVLMGRTFVPGQEFTTTNNAVAFTWKVDYISFNEKAYRLSRVLAERIPGGRAGRK